MFKKRKNVQIYIDGIKTIDASEARINVQIWTDRVKFMDANRVRIVNGAGREPIILDCTPGETYRKLFQRANINLDKVFGFTVGRGFKKDLDRPVKCGTTVTVIY